MEEQEEIQSENKLFIPNENIYKAHILDENGEVSYIFVFCAGLRSTEHLPDIFSQIEIQYYLENIFRLYSSQNQLLVLV